ncbi:substrate-binding domain-containing protein [Ruminococcaceae bacterium OttesenSCG-928-D13]|nr:substrate-binding domain-containing protein [Ruminococcaceae bacterium OttesenSCG-928-D13]
MKKTLAILLSCVLMVGLLAACGSDSSSTAPASTPDSTAVASTPESTPDATAGGSKIGVSMNSADEFRSSWLSAFTTQAEAAGYTVISTNADSSEDKQISDIESMIQQEIDIAVVHAFSADGIVPALDALETAGIPAILVDFEVNADNFITRVADEQYTCGVIQGEYVNEWLAEDDTRTANVGYIVGLYAMDAAMPRMYGFFETCTAAVNTAEGEGGWSADGAMSLTEDWLQAHPDMNVFVAMSDEMALGCIQALKAAGKDMDEVLVLGIDGSEEGLRAVQAGELDCTAARDVNMEAKVALETVGKILAGESVEKQIEPMALTAVSINNVDQFI